MTVKYITYQEGRLPYTYTGNWLAVNDTIYYNAPAITVFDLSEFISLRSSALSYQLHLVVSNKKLPVTLIDWRVHDINTAFCHVRFILQIQDGPTKCIPISYFFASKKDFKKHFNICI